MLQAVCRILIHILCAGSACDRLLVMIGCIFRTAIRNTTLSSNRLCGFVGKISVTFTYVRTSIEFWEIEWEPAPDFSRAARKPRVFGLLSFAIRYFSGCRPSLRYNFWHFPDIFSAISLCQHTPRLRQLFKQRNPFLYVFFLSQITRNDLLM